MVLGCRNNEMLLVVFWFDGNSVNSIGEKVNVLIAKDSFF